MNRHKHTNTRVWHFKNSYIDDDSSFIHFYKCCINVNKQNIGFLVKSVQIKSVTKISVKNKIRVKLNL